LEVSPLNSHCDVDSKAYLEKAELLYESGSFAPTPAYQQFPYYTLGYPTFIALIYKIFGKSVNWIILIQVLLTLLSALLIFITARRLFNELVGLIAFALTCTNVGFLTFSQFILTESILALFLILFFERFTAYLYNIGKLNETARGELVEPSPAGRRAAHKNLIFSALALGVSVIIKPAALYFPIFLFPLILHKTKSIKPAALFLLLFFSPIFLYMMHNKAVFDQFKIANLESTNTYFWFYPNVLAEKYGSTSDIERLKLQVLSGVNNSNIQAVKDLFWQDLKQNPFLFIYIWLKNVAKTFGGLFTTNLKVLVEPTVHGGDISFFKLKGTFWEKAWLYIEAGATSNWVRTVGLYETMWSGLRYILCFLALLMILGYRRYNLLYLVTTYIFYFSIITGHDGCARFRMMFEFVLIILAAYGLWILLANKESIKHDSDILCNPCGGKRATTVAS
jgi:4-amino-4-deoxy-L-arabinose transferase-like glycosyltransferase